MEEEEGEGEREGRREGGRRERERERERLFTYSLYIFFSQQIYASTQDTMSVE